ncbi:TPA: UvrD-helicase domain-containing protein [Aeromonas hydrophila]
MLPSLVDKLSLGFSVDEWLNAKLTIDQRRFVFSEIDKSIRLVGAAGTGKTISLVVKCLHEFKKSHLEENGFRCLFLTHNTSTAYNVQQSLDSMDHERLREQNASSFITVCTLQELANDAIKYSLNDLQPISLDGHASRDFQLETISSIKKSFLQSDWVTYKNRCSEEFSDILEAPGDSSKARAFNVAIMNEFACVLEADGVRKSADRRDKYITEKRKPWMMKLNNDNERRVILNLYDMFRDYLRQMKIISCDQMISDYLGYLDSNVWDNLRLKSGYDMIFVDELHLFNRQERMTFHNLIRDINTPPKIIMAYDTKQSPYDTFCQNENSSGNIAMTLGLGETKRYKLDKAFRYSQPIANLLEWIDSSFPTIGIEDELGEDWEKIIIECDKKDGIKPKLIRANTTREIYDCVFERAKRAAVELKSANRVAILCASDALFKRYAEAGAYRDYFNLIADREDISSINHNKKKFVFSMPEYVAGVQFDTVYLIEVNSGEVESGNYYSSALRRFISTVYVGASRAERVLEIYTSVERGGPSPALKLAISNGACDILNISDIE